MVHGSASSVADRRASSTRKPPVRHVVVLCTAQAVDSGYLGLRPSIDLVVHMHMHTCVHRHEPSQHGQKDTIRTYNQVMLNYHAF